MTARAVYVCDAVRTPIGRYGGAIAFGHPLGMSGARFVQTAAHQLEQMGQGRALVTMCVSIGQRLSIALETAR